MPGDCMFMKFRVQKKGGKMSSFGSRQCFVTTIFCLSNAGGI